MERKLASDLQKQKELDILKEAQERATKQIQLEEIHSLAENIKDSAHLTKKRGKSQEHEITGDQSNQQSESSGSSRDVLVEELSDIADRVEQLQAFNDFGDPANEWTKEQVDLTNQRKEDSGLKDTSLLPQQTKKIFLSNKEQLQSIQEVTLQKIQTENKV